MTLPLRPQVAVAAYEFLRATPPFHRWKLPPADEIEFRVVRDGTLYGYHQEDGERHIIAVSERRIAHVATLLATMAHEAIHLYLAIKGSADRGDHGPEFKKLAARVCKLHGYDPKAFL